MLALLSFNPLILAIAIRRLNLRKKKASETIRPLLSDLETTLSLVPQQTLPAEGRKLISSVSSAIHDILEWAIISTHDNEEEIVLCKVRSFLLQIVFALALLSR